MPNNTTNMGTADPGYRPSEKRPVFHPGAGPFGAPNANPDKVPGTHPALKPSNPVPVKKPSKTGGK